MKKGGSYGYLQIAHFDGTLFDDDYIPELPGDIVEELRKACQKDWANIEPSIFGTLFERVIDQTKRAQIGAHYTSYDDIMLVVEPVLMRPLRNEWHEVKQKCLSHIKEGDAKSAEVRLKNFPNTYHRLEFLTLHVGAAIFFM